MQTSSCLQEGPRGSLEQGHRRTSGADRTARRQTWRGLCLKPGRGARARDPRPQPIGRKWLNKIGIDSAVGNRTLPVGPQLQKLARLSAELDWHEQPVLATLHQQRDVILR